MPIFSHKMANISIVPRLLFKAAIWHQQKVLPSVYTTGNIFTEPLEVKSLFWLYVHTSISSRAIEWKTLNRMISVENQLIEILYSSLSVYEKALHVINVQFFKQIRAANGLNTAHCIPRRKSWSQARLFNNNEQSTNWPPLLSLNRTPLQTESLSWITQQYTVVSHHAF